MVKNVRKDFIRQNFNLSGGQNDKYDSLKIKDSEFSNISDWDYDEVGNLKMRSGTSALTTDTGNGLNGLQIWRKNSAANAIVASYDNKIAIKSGSILTDLYTGITNNNGIKGQSYTDTDGNDRFFITSPGDNVLCIEDDHTVRECGCTAPTVAPTVALNGAGSLTGDYYYSYTFVYPWGESSESPASALISPSSQEVTITLGEAYPTGAVGAWIYRTVDSATQRKLLTTITPPTTNYNDNLSDGVLGDNAPTGNDAPLASKWNYLYNNYMYYIDSTNEDRWYYSILDYPDIVYDTAYDNPIQDYRNRPVAIHSTLNPSFLIVFYEKSIIAYSGTSPFVGDSDTIERLDVNSKLGCAAPHSISRAYGDLLFLGSDLRVYSISRVSLSASETVEPISISERIDGTMQNNLNPDMIDKAYGIYIDRKYHLFVATGNSTTLDTVVTVDFNLETVPWVTSNPVACLSAAVYEDDSGTDIPIIGGANEKRIYQLFTGKTDAGEPISPEFTTKKWTEGFPFNRKVWRKLMITGEATPEYSFSVKVYVEKDAVIKTLDFDLSGVEDTATSTPVVWNGSVTWGQGNWSYNVSWSNSITEFKEIIDLREDGEGDGATYCDGEIMWFRLYNVSSTYRLKIKGFETRGKIMRARGG